MATSRSTSRSRDARVVAGVAASLLIAAACTQAASAPGGEAAADAGGAQGAGCPVAVPNGCPRAPSYASDVAPVVHEKCVPCHSPGGQASSFDYTTYAGLSKEESTALVRVSQCQMPPPEAGPDGDLSAEERTLLLQWFACGAPQN
jgi:hypothetical protein